MKQHKWTIVSTNNLVNSLLTLVLGYLSGLYLFGEGYLSILLPIVLLGLQIGIQKRLYSKVIEMEEAIQFIETDLEIIGNKKIDWDEHLNKTKDIPKPLKPGQYPVFDRNNIGLLYEPKKPL